MPHIANHTRNAVRLTAVVLIALATLTPASRAAEALMKTESWSGSSEEFAAFSKRIESMETRNLLTREKVKLHAQNKVSLGLLTDGHAGTYGDQGRMFLNAKPFVFAYYLGEPKTVTEIGVFSCNVDARANQDYEIRAADNSKEPGSMPPFDGPPTFTSGETVIGANRGGFHSYFVHADGSPLTGGKIDWIEFRVWPTYSVQAGQPGKDKTAAASSTVWIEVEALGTPDDIIVIPPEVLARREALRAAPRKPPYEKKATWQETMQAARETMLTWETELDRLMLPDSGVTLGPWHVIGPFAANAPEAHHIERQRTFDFTKPVAVKVGKETRELTWRKADGVADGEMTDLAKTRGAAPGQSLFLCRALTTDTEYERNKAPALGFGLGKGWAKLLPHGHVYRDSSPSPEACPNQIVREISVKPGNHQLLVRLDVPEGGAAPFWFMPHPPQGVPGAGPVNSRVSQRERLFDQLMRDFTDPVSRCQMAWEREDSIWITFRRHAMSRIEKFLSDWTPGRPTFLTAQYNNAAAQRLAELEKDLKTSPATLQRRIGPWTATSLSNALPATVETARNRYYAIAAAQEALADANALEALRLAVDDQAATFPERYPKAAEYRVRIAELNRQYDKALTDLLAGSDQAVATLVSTRETVTRTSREILLANPLLDPDVLPALLLIRGGPGFSSNWGGPNRLGNEIVSLSPVRPDGEFKTIYQGGNVSDMDLNFDATKILFSSGRVVQEINSDGTGHRQISQQTDEHVHHYDVCRLPNGKIMFVSTACEQAVPCTGGWYVGNLHSMDNDGKNERRLTFDQDHNWNPCVLNNGRVIYTRWEYTDTPHYFTRLLMTMNPDGSNQAEFYGSNSYWPNAMYWPRPIPGHPTKIVCVVSGHHGVGRVGELVLLDPSLGRHEADGVVQRIPGRGKDVEPVIKDGLVSETWPRFATPCPLAEPGTHRGAGKYFLATVKMSPWSNYGLYLVDIFDNMTLLLEGGYSMPIPLRARPKPTKVAPRIAPSREDALVYMVDVYKGGGIQGFPRGSIKALRVGTHQYRYGGNGDTRASSLDGGWDVKRILGTVPVHEDGSAFFRVPANTPIFVQPIDAEGKAQQTMRSWFVAMPGEIVSCIGCHEKQNRIPDSSSRPAAIANTRQPAEIKPWYGPARGFSFDREVQPVLDRRCAGCHNGQPRDGKTLPDFRSKQLHAGYDGPYSPAYLALHPFVRRAGFEADYHMAVPAEWQADTSHLVQMLKKGHHNVRLAVEEWDRLFTWIDFNIPYPANWSESHRPPDPVQVERRAKYKKLYGNIHDRDETPEALPPVAAFVGPTPAPKPPPAVKLEGWPVSAEQTAEFQKSCGGPLPLDLGEGVKMELVPIPAGSFVMGDVSGFPDEYPQKVVSISEPFHLAKFEVSNQQYARFDPYHDSAYIDGRGKDRFTRGYPANEPGQPVIRVTWHEAMAFCAWLSNKTGYRCTLPTEAEWEYACRAGTATPWHFGDVQPNMPKVANVNDNSLRSWNWGRCEVNYSDGQRFASPGGTFPANAWGLCDMHGNVAEWTLSPYRPYPYDAPVDDKGRNQMKVVRGGSWNDTFRFTRSASRWRYPPHQPAYNVGFRVLCRPVKVAQR